MHRPRTNHPRTNASTVMADAEPTAHPPAPWEQAKRIVVGVLACEAVGLLGGWVTRTSVDTWYPTLAKPWFTPPDWLFPPVWTLLYALMGAAAALVWMAEPVSRRRRRWAMGVFGAQLGLNLAWSSVFFGLQTVDGGLIVIVPLWISIVWTMERFARIRSVAAWLLAPYLAWVSYAAALNIALVQLNG
jgi:tryptophan-rich sensory protein